MKNKPTGIEEIGERCKRLANGVNDDFLGYVFGSLMDYGSADGGLLSLKKFEDLIKILNMYYVPKDSISTTRREAVEEYIEQVKEVLDETQNDYSYQAMGCGLEDRQITDRYEAMKYGFDKAIEMITERLPEMSTESNKLGNQNE